MVMDFVFVVATSLWLVHLGCFRKDRPQGGGYSKQASNASYPLDEICFVILTASSNAAVACEPETRGCRPVAAHSMNDAS